MVAAASDEIKQNSISKRIAEAEKQKELATSDLSFASNFLGDNS